MITVKTIVDYNAEQMHKTAHNIIQDIEDHNNVLVEYPDGRKYEEDVRGYLYLLANGIYSYLIEEQRKNKELTDKVAELGRELSKLKRGK